MAIPSQSSLSEEGCHWFDVGFSTDVFIVDVVFLGLASRASVLPFQKCVNSVSGFGKFRFLPFQIIPFHFFQAVFLVNNFGFQHSFSFSILLQCQSATNVTIVVQLHINLKK